VLLYNIKEVYDVWNCRGPFGSAVCSVATCSFRILYLVTQVIFPSFCVSEYSVVKKMGHACIITSCHIHVMFCFVTLRVSQTVSFHASIC